MMARKRNVYLGRRVRDIGRPGLDRPSEFREIADAILRDYKAGRISAATARGRLLLLLRNTYVKHNSKVKGWSRKTRESIRKYIRKLMSEVRKR